MITFIDDNRGSHGVEPICDVLPIAPSTYHKHVAELAVTDDGVSKIEQPFQFAQRHLGATLTTGLVEPFLGHCPEAVHIRQRASNFIDSAFGSRVDPFGNLPLDLKPLGARLGQRNCRINPQRSGRALVGEAVIHAPVSLSCCRNEQIEAAAIGQLVGLFTRRNPPHGQIGKHDAVSASDLIPSNIPSHTVNCSEFGWMPVDGIST